MKKEKPLDYNWALEADFANELMNQMLNIWRLVKTMRAEREMVWMESYRAWTADRLHVDENYAGRANLYWPQLRKEVETMTRRMMKGIFTDDYLRASSQKFQDEEITIANTQIVSHYLDDVMRFPVSAEPWIKQCVIYGTSPLRTYWKKEVNEQFFRERYFVEDSMGVLEPKTKIVQKPVVNYNAPVARAEDIFQTWVYPHNIQSAKDAKVIFYRTKVTWQELLERANKGMAVGVTPDLKAHVDDELKKTLDQAKGSGKESTVEFPRGLERLLQFSDSGIYESIQGNDYYDLLEIWFRAKLPNTDVSVPVVMEVLNEMFPVRVQRNPYWHQRAPLDFIRFIKPPPGEYYGRGLPEATINMQAQLNDLLNQGMDSATLSLNPITIINPAFAPNAESFEVEPGAQWYADPQGIKNFQFPDLSTTAIKNAELVRTIITQMSDNAPQLPDPIAGKARSTGQAQLAIDEWSTDLFNLLRGISEEGLEPFAQKIHMLIQQNVSDNDIIRISGKYAGTWIDRIVTPDDIMGNYDFHWITTLQIQQQSIKTQQMLNFMKVYATLPPQAQQEIKLIWPNFIIKLVRDGFMVRDVTNIIETPRLSASTPPEIENKILEQGGEIQVSPSDDDNYHIAVHSKAMQNLKKSEKYTGSLFQGHIQLHQQQLQQKAQERAAQAAQMAQMQAMAQQAQAGGKNPQQVSTPPSGKPPGNTGQINQSVNTSDMNRGLR